MSFDLKVRNGDLVIENGDLKKVIDSEKLIQDILKIALTEAGSNVLFPWYGSFISKSLIGSNLDIGITLQVSQSQLQNALDNLKNLQVKQVNTGQKVSADEQISSVGEISITRNKVDPRQFDVKIKVITKGFKPITTAFTISTI